MPKILIEITEKDVQILVAKILRDSYNIDIAGKDIHLMVKSKNNYKQQEWEYGQLYFKFEGEIPLI